MDVRTMVLSIYNALHHVASIHETGPPPLNMPSDQARALALKLRAVLKPFGFDVVKPLALGWYNAGLPPRLAIRRLRYREPAKEEALGILVGASVSLWTPFLQHCVAHQGWEKCQDPLQDYIEHAVTKGLARGITPSPTRILYTHRKTSEIEDSQPNYVVFQQLAVSSGLAYFDPVSHLLVHPQHGSWMALRALIVFDQISMDDPRPDPLPCPLTEDCQAKVAAAVQQAINHTRGAGTTAVDHCDMKSVWRYWVASREALNHGHPGRFSDEQLEYHYVHDKALLADCIEKQRRAQQ